VYSTALFCTPAEFFFILRGSRRRRRVAGRNKLEKGVRITIVGIIAVLLAAFLVICVSRHGMGQSNAKEDAQRYRDGYPGQDEKDDTNQRANVEFYSNTRECFPDGDFIDNIHKPRDEGGWRGHYERLEIHHGYIQWLFPIREPGMNSESFVLTAAEARILREDPKAKERFIKSFELILGEVASPFRHIQ
jgi:hypothetical protein